MSQLTPEELSAVRTNTNAALDEFREGQPEVWA